MEKIKGLKGFTDNPVESTANDLFNVEKYIRGLSQFIEICDTPMTIAIQGDWGSGKTSMMNMIKENLDSSVIPVWFNTWKFSQFDLENQLGCTFLSYLLDELSKYVKEDKKKKLNDCLVSMKKLSLRMIGVTSELLSGGGQAGKEMMDEILSENSIDMISRLKDEFQDTINELIRERGEEARVVIFIDDLDRLQPFRAVELLEILKIFLDCDNCVFVLAIDYGVVAQGIQQKYNGTLDGEKGRKFFDKIIQVPFKMPVAHYDIKNYVSDALQKLGIISDQDMDCYVDIIRLSVGCNPRAMKRLFNAYLLLNKVYEGETVLDESFEKMLLFASLCMQLSFEDVYNFIVMNIGNELMINPEFFEQFRNSGGKEDSDDGNETVVEDKFSNEEQLNDIIKDAEESGRLNADSLRAFLEQFAELLVVGDCITDEAIERLRNVLSMTSVTASVIPGNHATGKGVRHSKVFDENFVEKKLSKGEVKSFNGCKVQWYRIGTQEKKENVGSFGDIFVDALAYAYKHDTQGFLRIKERAESTLKDKHRRLFVIEENKNKTSKEIPGTGIKVSTYTSNDKKAQQIQDIYRELGLDSGIITLSMKEAKRVTE